MIRWTKKVLRMTAFKPCYRMITHKFYFGQGATLRMNLTHRTYEISLETIWEDHSLVEI